MTALGAGVHPTGLGVYAEMVAPRLRRLDADVTLVSWSGAPLGGVPTIAAGAAPRGGGLVVAVRRILWLTLRLRGLARATRADAVLHLLPELGRAPVPQLGVVHDVIPLVAPTTWRQQLYFRTVVAWSVRSAAAVVADSEPTRADVARLFGVPSGRISIVPAGVDLETFRPLAGPAPQHAYLIAVGSHAPHKRLDLLLRTFARSSVRLTHDLYVVGPTSRYTPPLVELAGRLDIGDRVRWLSYIDRAALVGLYAQADAYVSFSGYEGFGLPALEALACGTPILITDVGAARGLASEASLIMSSSASEELESGLEVVVALGQRPYLQEAARAAAERFPWERTARELLAVALTVAARRETAA